MIVKFTVLIEKISHEKILSLLLLILGCYLLLSLISRPVVPLLLLYLFLSFASNSNTKENSCSKPKHMLRESDLQI